MGGRGSLSPRNIRQGVVAADMLAPLGCLMKAGRGSAARPCERLTGLGSIEPAGGNPTALQQCCPSKSGERNASNRGDTRTRKVNSTLGDTRSSMRPVVARRVPLPESHRAPAKPSPVYVGAASRSRRTVPTLAAGLILDQADVAAVSHQVHLALFYDAQLDIKAMPQLKSHRVFAQTLLPTRWMRGSSPRMTNVERQPGRQILTLLVPGGRGDKGNLAPIKLTPVGWVEFLTRPNIQIASARCWVSHALDPTYASRPAVLFWCHRGSGDAVSAGRKKEPSAGGSILPRVLNLSREPWGALAPKDQ